MANDSSALVSIVVVAHDDWPHLEVAVESALNQSYEPVEVIVVDNDSSDETAAEIPARFGDRVAYCRQPNRFDGGGRNAGFELASGAVVQFLDGDDLLAPDKIEKQMSLLDSDAEVDIVYGDYRVFGSATVEFEDGTNRDHADLLLALLAPEGNGAGLVVHSALFRRRALERIGSWDEAIPTSDQDYWLRAAAAGCRFRYCPGSLCFYRQRPGQMSSRQFPMLREMEMTWGKAMGYVTDEPYRSLLSARLARLRFVLALAGERTGRRDSLAQLQLARETSPETVSRLALTLGALLIAMPGGSKLARARTIRPLRRLGARFLGLEDSRLGGSRSP